VASVVLDSDTEPKKNGDAVGVTVFAEVQWVRPEAALKPFRRFTQPRLISHVFQHD